MLSEYFVKLCFIGLEQDTLGFPFLEQELRLIFQAQFVHEMEKSVQDGLDIVLFEGNGMCEWETEEDLLQHLENNLSDMHWHALNGYHIHLELKEDHGSCRVKKEVPCDCHTTT